MIRSPCRPTTLASVADSDPQPIITPSPSAEEAVAIVAAVEALWPKPTVLAEPSVDRTTAWRFSGRWWRRDRFARSERPWS